MSSVVMKFTAGFSDIFRKLSEVVKNLFFPRKTFKWEFSKWIISVSWTQIHESSSFSSSSSSVLMIVFISFLLHSQWHIFFLSFDDTGINNDEMITDSCSCLSLSVSMFTLLTLLSSVSASDSLLPHAFVSPSSSSFAIHTEKKKKMWKNTMGNFSLFSHDNDFHTIIVFEVSLCIISWW